MRKYLWEIISCILMVAGLVFFVIGTKNNNMSLVCFGGITIVFGLINFTV